EAGGTLIGEAYFAGWDVEEGRHHTTVPGYGLHEVFGVRQKNAVPPGADGRVEIIAGPGLAHLAEGERVYGMLAQETFFVEGAEVLATYADSEAAVTRHRFGRGQGILVGSYVACPYRRQSHEANGALLASLVELADLSA